MEIIHPEMKINIFYYNCGDKFITHIIEDYIKKHSGNIVFANGDMCLIYKYNNGCFKIFKNITANLQKRQKKGGQSAVRIARLAEETRHKYIIKIIDYLNLLNKNDKTLLFGSNEITKMILENKTLLCNIEYKGFLEFDTKTINCTHKWCKILNETDENKYDNYYQEIIYCLQNNIDKLDFDINNKNQMKYYLIKNNNVDICDKNIPFPNKSNSNYNKLCNFEYIGVKFYSINYDELNYNDDL